MSVRLVDKARERGWEKLVPVFRVQNSFYLWSMALALLAWRGDGLCCSVVLSWTCLWRISFKKKMWFLQWEVSFWATGLVAGYGRLLMVCSCCGLIGSTFRVVMWIIYELACMHCSLKRVFVFEYSRINADSMDTGTVVNSKTKVSSMSLPPCACVRAHTQREPHMIYMMALEVKGEGENLFNGIAMQVWSISRHIHIECIVVSKMVSCF